MKKQISILLSLLVVFSSLIVSCDDGGDDLNPNICKITVSSGGNGSVSITNYIGTSENVLLGSNIEVVATPDSGCEFIGWYVGNSETPISTSEKFTFVASKNTSLVAKFVKFQNLTICSAGNGRVSFKGTSGTSNTLLPGTEITVVATPDSGYEFQGWYVSDAEEPVSTDAEYTFTVSESVTLVAKFKNQFEATGSIGGHAYVDLGLSVKWASCNVGATEPWEYGDYFAWGEISPKSSYYESNSVTYGKKMGDISGNAQYDAARANWGGNWRIPTLEEQEELLNNCTWEWTTLNGVNGRKVTGPNGNSIFLPAAGYRYGTSLSYGGSIGYYWSSSPNEINTYYAYYLTFYSGNYDWRNDGRCYGQGVRPVLE